MLLIISEASHPRPISGPHSRPSSSMQAERERRISGMAAYRLSLALPSSPLALRSVPRRPCREGDFSLSSLTFTEELKLLMLKGGLVCARTRSMWLASQVHTLHDTGKRAADEL